MEQVWHVTHINYKRGNFTHSHYALTEDPMLFDADIERYMLEKLGDTQYHVLDWTVLDDHIGEPKKFSIGNDVPSK